MLERHAPSLPKLPVHSGILLLLTASFALWWLPLASTFRLASTSSENNHIFMIAPLSCGLIYLNRKAPRPASEKSVGIGSALLFMALLIAGFTQWGTDGWPPNVRLSLSMFGLVTWWIASVVFYFGMRAFRALLFPLLFLYWLVPMPAFALDGATHFLQQQSAFVARVLFMVAGVPVTQDGVVLSVPGLDVEIARECSSIRSSMMLMVTTMVLAHLFLRSWWRKALLILAAVPLAAIKNGLRIFTLVQIGTRVDPTIFDSDLHHRGGILFFALSVAMTLALLWFLRRTENLESCGPRTASPR
jgi:exosortase